MEGDATVLRVWYTYTMRSARPTTARGSRHDPLPLLLLDLSNDLHCPLLINGGTRQVIVGQVMGLNQAILALDGSL
jgi:hypothetical protein